MTYKIASWTVEELLEHVDRGRLSVPKWQRLQVWRPQDRQALIGSLLLGLPIGQIAVWLEAGSLDTKTGKPKLRPRPRMALIDGQQRLSTLKLFEGNKFAFDYDVNQHPPKRWRTKWIPAKQKLFSELTPAEQASISDAEISVLILTGDEDVAIDSFVRMNDNGLPLSDQEVRHAAFRDSLLLCEVMNLEFGLDAAIGLPRASPPQERVVKGFWRRLGVVDPQPMVRLRSEEFTLEVVARLQHRLSQGRVDLAEFLAAADQLPTGIRTPANDPPVRSSYQAHLTKKLENSTNRAEVASRLLWNSVRALDARTTVKSMGFKKRRDHDLFAIVCALAKNYGSSSIDSASLFAPAIHDVMVLYRYNIDSLFELDEALETVDPAKHAAYTRAFWDDLGMPLLSGVVDYRASFRGQVDSARRRGSREKLWMGWFEQVTGSLDPKRLFDDDQKKGMLKRSGGLCEAGCGKKLVPKTAHGHHVVPWARFGRTKIDNGQALCGPCHADVHKAMDEHQLLGQSVMERISVSSGGTLADAIKAGSLRVDEIPFGLASKA